MLGSPLLRAAVVLAVLLLLLLPLRSFTAPRTRAALPAPPETADSRAHLEIVSTKAPFTFSVTHLGKTIWRGEAAAGIAQTDVSMSVPKEGVDLSVQIDWKSPGVAAAKLTLTHGHEAVERSLWGDGRAADVLTYP